MNCKKILAISASGIGNTILFTPFLAGLKRKYSDARITLVAFNRGMADVVDGGPLADEVRVIPRSLFTVIRFIMQLRRERYDVSVTAFPSNKLHFNLFAWLAGARKRITHQYPVGYWRTLAFLQNVRIPAVEGIHDVEQNMNLLKCFGVDPALEERTLSFQVSKEDENYAETWLAQTGLKGRLLVAIHPGAGTSKEDWQGSAKRWPADRFAKLCDKVIEEFQAKILVFGGPDESEVKNRVHSQSSHPESIVLVGETLKRAAAILRYCRLMISNDSGLMHVAVARNVPTLAIVGPSNPVRTAPFSPHSRIVKSEEPCMPCLKYPFRTTSSVLACPYDFKCLTAVTVEAVLQVVREMLQASP